MAPAIFLRSKYCFLDIDINNHRAKHALGAAFVRATDTRYGFTSQDLRKLGGSEIHRVQTEDLIVNDHDFAQKVSELGGYALSHLTEENGGRIIVELFWDVAPLACENFATLCRNSNNLKSSKPQMGVCGKPLAYIGSKFHRVVAGFVMQGGDFVMHNGAGGESIYNGKKFKDERAGLQLKHDQKGVLSMGNSGKNSNTSQFFLTFAPAPQCDGKHVVFGRVISGFDVVDAVENVAGSKGNSEPTFPVTITNCGVYEPLKSPGAGYWFDQPDDSFQGSSPSFMCRPRVGVIAPSETVLAKFRSALSSFASFVPLLSPTENVSSISAKQKANRLLKDFALDVILVAPACKDEAPAMPEAWIGIEGDVVIVTKPIGALAAVRNSWVKHRGWTLDGCA